MQRENGKKGGRGGESRSERERGKKEDTGSKEGGRLEGARGRKERWKRGMDGRKERKE